MLFLLSPARNMIPTEFPGIAPTPPPFREQTMRLVEALRQHGPLELESLLSTTPQKALTLLDTYQRFETLGPGTPAATTYRGMAYQHLNASGFDAEEFAFAQEHLRILSAMHGLLRPADGIVPHRLGLDCGLRIDGSSVLSFWGDRIYRALFPRKEPVIGLASKEYIQLISPHLKPFDRVITCEFTIQHADGTRATPTSVKAARGEMARFLIVNRIDEPEGMKDFDWDGYRFIPGRSSPDRYLFIRQRTNAGV